MKRKLRSRKTYKSAVHSDKVKTEQAYLNKTDPPKFDVDLAKFPDFKRKWLTYVRKANLSAESELDRLKDNMNPSSQYTALLISGGKYQWRQDYGLEFWSR